MKHDALSIRMKRYEETTRTFLPIRTHTIIRIDGKAFHTYTQGLDKPFDEKLVQAMNHTALQLCVQLQNVVCAYVQSDEISLLLADYKTNTTQQWFEGNIQKMCSISASVATSSFNHIRTLQAFTSRTMPHRLANFDARVFTLPAEVEVHNYFLWRMQDCVRNSIQSVAQSLYSHKELHGKRGSELQEMIFQKGINWNDYDDGLKRGRMIVRKGIWVVENPPILSQDLEYIPNLLKDFLYVEEKPKRVGKEK